MKILTVVGNRPQFVKAAAVSGLLRERHEELLVHTGQHHDDALSRVFFDELGLARPDRELGVAGGSNSSQTARMLAAVEPLLSGARGSIGGPHDRPRDASGEASMSAPGSTLAEPPKSGAAEGIPDAVLVYGDTNSTLAGALAGAQAGVPVIHVEAGMRSFDRTMPEELNRVLVDHMSSLLLCPSETAAANLRAEGIGCAQPAPLTRQPPDQAAVRQGQIGSSASGRPRARARARLSGAGAAVAVVGDVMVDVALRWQPRARATAEAPARYGVEPGEYVLLTAHRAGNVDDEERLSALVDLIGAVAAARTFGPVVFPVHPRTRARLQASGLDKRLASDPGVRLAGPVGYAELAALLCQARAVLTDSGGVQKEAYIAGVPCVTLRDRTEWIETVETGWNALADLDATAALAALERKPTRERLTLYGEGDAAQRCVDAIDAFLGS